MCHVRVTLYGSQSALGKGRWFLSRPTPSGGVVLQAFDVPGVEPASVGWVTPAGTPSHAYRPAPVGPPTAPGGD